MAIPFTPPNFFIQQGNNKVLLSFDAVAGALSYDIQRSTDGVNFTSVANAPNNTYLDTAVVLGTQYFYKVASVNASGTSGYTAPESIVPAPNAELSLGELRLRCQERADRVNSQFVTTPEWNFFINQAMYELYDLLITVYEDYFEAPEVTFTVQGNSQKYPLPDGLLTFTDSQTGQPIVAPPFYKLSGVDLAVSNTNNGYVNMNKYNLIDRNKFVYPNSGSTIYGVFNLQYRLMGNSIRFIPVPSAGSVIRLLYVPRLPTLLADTDITNIGYSGWLQYVIVRAAKYALDKEESDTTTLTQEIQYLKKRIEESAMNRDLGQPDTVSDTANTHMGWGYGGFDGKSGY